MSNYRRYFANNYPIFITTVSYNRKYIFLNNIDILRNSLKNAKKYYEFDIIAITVMKDHLHFILFAKNPNNLPKIIRLIKVYFTMNIKQTNTPETLSESRIKRGEKNIWQRRYYDHIIRNENDLWKHIDYIHYNSLKHYNIAPKDWEYSSFKKFVQNKYYDINWCNVSDKYDIKNLELVYHDMQFD